MNRLRGVRLALIVMAVTLALASRESRAQFGYGYYPGGYGGYGWGGWGATPQGSIARGLGFYNMGAGIYNKDTAIANAINANTVMRWNEYLYEAQQERNRREHLRMARRQDRDSQTGEIIQQRLRNNPTDGDIASGDALNVVLDDLTDPRVHSSALRLASAPIKGSVVRAIPFVNASEAVTISLNQLVAKDESWPPALRGQAFAPGREAYRKAIATALKEDEEGVISPETLRNVRQSVAKLRAQAQNTFAKGSDESIQAENYLRTLMGMSRMLDNPDVEQVLAELEKIDNTTVGQLLGFMHTFNLRFGPATTPRQEALYTELYPILVDQRDKLLKDSGLDKGPVLKDSAKRDVSRGGPHDFFRGMNMEVLEGRRPNAKGTSGKPEASSPQNKDSSKDVDTPKN